MSNLPPPNFQGVVEHVASIKIDAPLDKVWAIVIDLDSYPLWNPYHRSAVVVDHSSHRPTEDKSLRADVTLEVMHQMPPSLDTFKKPALAITWRGGRHRMFFRGEHSQALSVSEDGKTLYEARHVFGGLSGHLIKLYMDTTMQLCLQGVSSALRQRAEAQS